MNKHAIILLGPPGSGKGTVAEKLVQRLNYYQLSTGDLLREEIKNNSELGKKVKAILSSGKLVDDQIILELVTQKVIQLDHALFLFDGFPRTVVQAELLKQLMAEHRMDLHRVFLIKASPETVIKRISGRRVCLNCNRVFNAFYARPIKENTCDNCQSTLTQRDDDVEEKVKVRYQVYVEQTTPLIDFYREKLVEVNAEKNPEDVFADILILTER